MDEEVFWCNYFFRVKYIRLALGIEKVGSNNSYTIIRSLREEDVIYKLEPQSKVAVTTRKEANHTLVSNQSTSSRSPNASSPSSNTNIETTTSIAGIEGVEDTEERERQNSIETRRIAEAALAAEVEAELDDDDIDLTDLGDLDLGDDDCEGDDTDDFDDLGDLDDDGKLEAQIAHELAQEDEKSK